MTRLRVLLARLLSLFFRSRLDVRLDEEMRAHLELATDDNIARGMTAHDARLAALRSFGGVTQTKEAWRDVRGLPGLEALWQDLRYAVRTYRKTPAFTLVALLTLTLAIGANTAVFSLPNALVLRDLPVRDPASLVQVATVVVRGTDISYPALKRAVEALGRENVGEMVSLRYITDRALLQERLTAMLSGFFGALALLLAGVGLFGLMSYTVARQRREIGIRMALGAEPRRVMADVVRDGVTVTLTGVAVGFALALASVQLVKSLLFGITPHDPLTLVAAPISLLVIAIVACLLPAARAARVDPMIALRTE